MRVLFEVTGGADRHPGAKVDVDVVPRVGDRVVLRDLDEDRQFVRSVRWHPEGTFYEGEPDGVPFVRVMLGPRRRIDPGMQIHVEPAAR